MKILLIFVLLFPLSAYANEDQPLLLNAAIKLGLIKSYESEKPASIYSSGEITSLSIQYVKANNFVNIKKYDLKKIEFNKEKQRWSLFFRCKPTPQGGFAPGCHFLLFVDNKKNPSFKFNRGR